MRRTPTLASLAAPQGGAVSRLVRPGATDGLKYIVFLRPRDLRREAWAGVRVGPDEAVAAYGADAAFKLEEFDSKMSSFDRNTYTSSGYIADADALYVADGNDTEWIEKFREQYDPLRIRRGGPVAFSLAIHWVFSPASTDEGAIRTSKSCRRF